MIAITLTKINAEGRVMDIKSKFELVVNCYSNGGECECDRRSFDTEEDAKQYYQAEHAHSDSVTGHTIEMLDKNGNRSIFDDIDK